MPISSAHAGNEVDRLLKEYGKIETVSCMVRRTKVGAIGKLKFLSRVYWTNKDQLHAEGITPVKRRTIADGKRLYQYVEGDPKGFSRPIDELSEPMTISLRLVPGTAMEHLLRLKEKEEVVLPRGETAAKRVGIQTKKNYVLLLIDPKSRLVGIEFYKTAELKNQEARYAYRDFKEVLPGVWVPLTHEATINNSKTTFKETVKIDRFIANGPIAASLFVPANFFDKKIAFVDDFEKMFLVEKKE